MGANWVFPKTVKKAIYGWKGSFVGNHIAFIDGMVDVHRLKYSFVYNLWSLNRVFLGEEVHSILDFLEWMAFR